MVKEYTLEGLECANCANKIETAVASMAGISSAAVNIITTSLKVEANDSYGGNIDTDIKKIVYRYEPDVRVLEKNIFPKSAETEQVQCACEHEHGHESDNGMRQVYHIIFGAAVFVAGTILKLTVSPGKYIEFGVFFVSFMILGWRVLAKAGKNIIKGQLLDENFLMSIATIGAFAIGDFSEAAAVMLFYQVGEYFQGLAVRRSKKSITDLMDIRPDFANAKINGEIVRVTPESVKAGDIIVVKPGEKIPLDGVVLEGTSMLDTSALTGESVPRSARPTEEVLSGCINQDGVLTIEVTKSFGESTVAKILDLVQNAGSRKASTENFITTFSRYYTPIVVGIAALLAIVPPLLLGGNWADWINRGLIFLVISCPCALVISIPLGFFGGIGNASKKGILVKGGNFLEALNKLDTIVFDKTGTLSKGVFEVTSITPANGFEEKAVLEYVAKAEAYSNHPIAASIQKAYGKSVDKSILADYKEISGQGIKVKVDGKEVLVGNNRLMSSNGICFSEPKQIGTKIYIAVEGAYAGSLVIADELKADSASAIAGLKNMGIRKTVMLTGDNSKIGRAIADELNLDEVHSELLPAQKVEKLEELISQNTNKGKIAYVGDGINDAPVLARADVGIAMGGLGSDAAVEAADVVLMTDEPAKLLDAVKISKFTKKIVWQNIIFALGVKGIFLIMGAFGVATMWEAVFADVGVAVIAILNAMRILKMK